MTIGDTPILTNYGGGWSRVVLILKFQHYCSILWLGKNKCENMPDKKSIPASEPAQPRPVVRFSLLTHPPRDPEFPLRVIHHLPRTPDIELHEHEFVELVIVCGGQAAHRTLAGDYPIATGDVFVAPTDGPHGYEDIHELELINVLFDLERLMVDPRDLAEIPGYQSLFILEPEIRKRHVFKSGLTLSGTDYLDVLRLVEELEAELTRDEPGWRSRSTALFTLLLCRLARLYTENPSARTGHIALLGTVLSHIERNLAESITVPELAEVAHMSRSVLYKHFRTTMGCTPVEYILKLRIERATALLRNTEDSIARVAGDVGFNHFSYFARKFRERMGVTPKEYRAHRGR